MAQPFTNSYQWRKVREQVLKRDNYLCQIRGPKCTLDATVVDHIVPTDDGGPMLDPDNLRAACSWCNNWRAVKQKQHDGWRRNEAHVILVTSPPGGEARFYAEAHAGP